MKDLVNAPTQKYDNMYSIIGNASSDELSATTTAITTTIAAAEHAMHVPMSSYLPQSVTPSDTMKNELKYFLKNQLNR